MERTNQETSRQVAGASGGFAGGRFFYSNLRIQEILTTIRYGVETRRGLILLSGDPGSGKTTLLFRAIEELPPHIVRVIVPSPALGFGELLHFLRLQLEQAGKSESENEAVSAETEALAVRRCQSLLRERLQSGKLVALVVDDAHLLPERTLRNLVHNFLGGSAESPEGALLQMILAGNRFLKGKLSQAALIPLRRRRPVVCEAGALSGSETAAYIQHGLRAAQLPEDLFDERALKRVALLSRGSPRIIDALCSHALARAGEGAVTAELIETAARKIKVAEKSDSRNSNDDDEAFGIFADDDESEPHPVIAFSRPSLSDEPAFFEAQRERARFGWLPQNGHFSDWLRALTVLTVIAAAAALIPAEAAVSLLESWRAKVVELALERGNVSQEKVSEDENPPAAAEPSTSAAKRPADQESGVSAEKPAVQRGEPPSQGPGAAPERARRTAPSAPGPRDPAAKPFPERDLQSEVAKAIASRAIMGVEVSVVQGTAILEGRVASERQRRAAERAALSVSGVERVRNRISITYG